MIPHGIAQQALKMLRTPDLKPFIVYVKAPSFERLRDTRTTAYARSTFVENGNRAFTVSSQGISIRPFPGLVNFVPAVAYLFCLNLPAAFSQPGNGLLV